MNVPEYLQPFYRIIKEKQAGNYCVTGELVCCGSNDFAICYTGNLRKNILGHKYFVSGEKRIILTAKCNKCSGKIHIFDNAIDGYDNCIETNDEKKDAEVLYPFWCDKCHHNTYQILVSYEYSDFKELEDLDILDKKNSFTWIKVSLRCTECHRAYRNIVDFEVG